MIRTDLLIVGATESGWAAAIQAARMGTPSITIVHDGKWVGGQFTEQALACVDENKGVGKVGWGVEWHPMKRSFHRSGLFKEWMDRIEDHNTRKYGSPMPGRPYHGPSTFRPAEAEQIFREMLQPWMDRGRIRLILDHYPVAAAVADDGSRPRLSALSFAPLGSNRVDLRVEARLTIDASDWGDAIQLSGAAFECGPDPKSRYDEPSAPEDMSDNPPNEMNPITWAMIVEQTDADARNDKPDRFDDRNFVRTSRISLAEMRDLQWDRGVRLGSILHWPDAGKNIASPRQLSIYNVRRLIDGYTSKEKQTVILLNYMLGQDYPLERLPQHVVDQLEAIEPGSSTKNIVRMSRRCRQVIFNDAKRHSLSLLFHLQNFVHDRAEDTTHSFRWFRLSDEFGTPDRLPPKPYIRESLRLKAMYMMREQDGRNADGATKNLARERFARVMYPDGVLCWQFHYDFHRTGRAYLRDEGTSGPWIDFEKPGRHTHHVSDRSVFPLRSLVPEEMDGLLGAQKNLGYSSIVCAAIRLHDQCVAIGQAAGATAAVALKEGIDPREIPWVPQRLEQVREGLCGHSVEGQPLLLWPFRDLPAEARAFVAINRLSAMGVVSCGDYEVDFRPEAIAGPAWQKQMLALADKVTLHALPKSLARELELRQPITRGEFCQLLWRHVRAVPLRPVVRLRPEDADDDGIADREDPTPLIPGPPVVWSIDRAGVPLAPGEDGLPAAVAQSDRLVQRFDFAPHGTPPVAGFTHDQGQVFSESRGHGWESSMVQNSRRRNVFKGQARDTFLFTRDAATWECTLEPGTYEVTVCVGDAGYPQPGQRVSLEGTRVVVDVTTEAGQFLETTHTVEVTDGRLTMRLGPQSPSQNTCVNWIEIQK